MTIFSADLKATWDLRVDLLAMEGQGRESPFTSLPASPCQSWELSTRAGRLIPRFYALLLGQHKFQCEHQC